MKGTALPLLNTRWQYYLFLLSQNNVQRQETLGGILECVQRLIFDVGEIHAVHPVKELCSKYGFYMPIKKVLAHKNQISTVIAYRNMTLFGCLFSNINDLFGNVSL